MKRIDVAIAVIVRDGKILICQRKNQDSFGGFWEFPGGKCEPGESLPQCLQRELREELDISATPVRPLSIIEHDYPTARLTLHPFLCQADAGSPRPIECQQIAWVSPQELSQYSFPAANRGLLDELVRWFTNGADAACNS